MIRSLPRLQIHTVPSPMSLLSRGLPSPSSSEFIFSVWRASLTGAPDFLFLKRPGSEPLSRSGLCLPLRSVFSPFSKLFVSLCFPFNKVLRGFTSRHLPAPHTLVLGHTAHGLNGSKTTGPQAGAPPTAVPVRTALRTRSALFCWPRNG